MKLPPVLAEKVAPADSAAKAERDRSFLIFAGIVLVAIALGFKSELLGPGQVWALALALVLIAAPAVLGYLRGTEEFPRIEHYIPVALGAITLAGLSLFPDVDLLKYGALTAVFGAGFVIAARLDYLRLRDQEKRGHIVLQEILLVVVVFGAYLVLVRNTVEDTFTRNVVLEYGAFAVVLIYLFVASYQPR